MMFVGGFWEGGAVCLEEEVLTAWTNSAARVNMKHFIFAILGGG